ncbi:MAG: universal stress protein [Burkholderiaceae bacterium]
MTYQSILLHIDHSPACQRRIAFAASLAAAHNAHLIGLAATGLVYSPYIAGGEAIGRYYEEAAEALRTAAQQAAAAFSDQMKAAGVRSWEAQVLTADAGSALARQSRFVDLVILGQTDPGAIGTDSGLPQYLLLHNARPVIVFPYAGEFDGVVGNVMIAWSGTKEAARAVSDALPILQKAKTVRLIVFNRDASLDKETDKPGSADISTYLARHQVNLVTSREETDIDVGNAILSRMADYGSDLLVMGGYGHSRFREILLGGVTRTILAHMTAPVLMAH